MKFSKEILSEIRTAAKLGKDRDIQAAVEKALEEINSKRHWKKEVEEWISVTDSYWSVTKVYKELQAVTKNDMGAIRKAVHDLKLGDVIEPWKARGEGWYRRKESELVDIDWRNADTEPLEIRMPLELDDMVNLYDGDIFVIAGEPDAGKTSLCLNIAEMNMDNWDCHYFSSELGGPKIRKRISFFETAEELWRVDFHYRLGNYQDVMFKNSINIIDFIMQTDNFWEVGTKIKDIHAALKDVGSGIAIIAIQKSEHKEYGRGGDITLELASLYVTLSRKNRAKIVKLKDWKVDSNPNQKVCDYKLVNASKFIQSSPWHYAEDEDVGRGTKWR